MRIWLRRIGVKRSDRPEGWNKPVKRAVKCWFAKRVYGVDPRETYDLESTWRMWMYEHLKMYLKQASPKVDLTFHKIQWNGDEWALEDLIHMMMDRLEYALNPKLGYNDYDEADFKYVHEAEDIWKTICPYMWW